MGSNLSYHIYDKDSAEPLVLHVVQDDEEPKEETLGVLQDSFWVFFVNPFVGRTMLEHCSSVIEFEQI